MAFVNDTVTPNSDFMKKVPGAYGFRKPTNLLLVWSNPFQSLISQAGTYLLTGKFHDRQTGIFKCEGGCNIAGVGDLVLSNDYCYVWLKI